MLCNFFQQTLYNPKEITVLYMAELLLLGNPGGRGGATISIRPTHAELEDGRREG